MAHPKIPGKYSCNINVPKDGDIQLAWMESRGGGGGGASQNSTTCTFIFNNNICSTPTQFIFIQQEYLFNFNQK